MTSKLYDYALRASGRTKRRRQAAAVAVLGLLVLVTVPVQGQPTKAPSARPVWEVNDFYTNEFGLDHATGLAYVPQTGALYLSKGPGAKTAVVGVTPVEDPAGTLQLEGLPDEVHLSFDRAGKRLAVLSNGELVTVEADDVARSRSQNGSQGATPSKRKKVANLGVSKVGGTTFDASGTWFILDSAKKELVVLEPGTDPSTATPTRIPLGHLGQQPLRGLAYNPADDLLYVASPASARLYALDRSAAVQAVYDLGDLKPNALTAIEFAPSADNTDPSGDHDLYMTDTVGNKRGRVREVALEPAPTMSATATTTTLTLVKTIDTSKFTPAASPDPAGIAYQPVKDRLHITDMDVDETTGAGYKNVNLWETTRLGSVTATGTTWTGATHPEYSKEPTGLAYDPANSRLFISDDNKDTIFILGAGPDKSLYTSDDIVPCGDPSKCPDKALLVGAFSGDPEGVAYDSVTGDLYIADGVGMEVYRVTTAGKLVSQFDVEKYGIQDPEGITYDPNTKTLLIVDRKTDDVFEVSTSGSLLASFLMPAAANSKNPAGIEVALGSNGSGSNFWVVDRMVDNGADPKENDGKLFELSSGRSAPAPTNPSLSIGDASVTEGDSGTKDAVFTVTRSGDTTQSVSVDFTTGDGTASQPGDYTKTTGTLTFASSETSKTIKVPVVGDTLDELDETFTVTLSNATNATILDGQGLGTIVDNDGTGGTPTSVELSPSDDAWVIKDSPDAVNNTGSLVVDFSPLRETLLKFSLPTEVVGKNITKAILQFNVTDESGGVLSVNTAQHDNWNEGTVTWNNAPAVGQQVGSKGPVPLGVFEVDVTTHVHDQALTTDSIFTYRLTTTSSNGVVTRSTESPPGPKLVVTLSGESQPSQASLSIGDAAPVTEGDSGTTDAVFTVTRSGNLAESVTVNYATDNGTATQPGDYTATSGTLTFAANDTTETITVKVTGDTADEPDETFTVNLSSPSTNATIADGQGLATIVDNDPTPPTTLASLSINDVSVTEGNADTSATFTVTRTGRLTESVGVNFATADGSAKAAQGDYLAQSGTLNFGASETTKTITVTVKGDTVDEPNETFVVNLSNPTTNAEIADGQGQATILDDDTGTTPTEVVLSPSADAWVRQDSPDTTLNTAALVTDGSPVKNALLKFSLPTEVVGKNITKAILQFNVTDESGGVLSVNTAQHDNWDEATVTWNNAPAVGQQVGSKGPVPLGVFEVDVTTHVHDQALTTDSIFTYRLTTTSGNGITTSSKEGASAPKLILTIAP